MDVTTALIAGFAGGWALEWVIDYLYFRKNAETKSAEIEALRADNKNLNEHLHTKEIEWGAESGALRAELDLARAQAASLQTRADESDKLRGELAAMIGKVEGAKAASATAFSATDEDVERLRGEIDEYREALAQQKAEVLRLRQQLGQTDAVDQKDDLEEIDGIGPVFEGKLYAAGIKTFSQLAGTPIDRIREIIAPKKWQKIEPEKWVIEAAKLASGR